MIDLLNGWLKQIVILVLIATFLDLLLPNNAMERYVKLVMGLLIIMAILSPIFQLIRQDLDLASLAFEQRAGENTDLASLDTINREGKQLRKTQDRLLQEQVEKRLAEMIQKDVEKQFPVEVIQTQVQAKGGDPSSPRISRVQLTVRPVSKEDRSTTIREVEEVEPVTIEPGGRGSVSRDGAEPSARQKVWHRRIVNHLQQTWKLLPEQIRVIVAEAS